MKEVMEEVLVSVVVPVFGVEKYIERCARSLFEQTLPEMEFIFVDDCTKDRSIEILERVLEEYPHRHGQIHIVHHENNKGLPQARKTGIQLAKGQYIAHCDSDDWVDRDMYRSMYNVARCKNADIVFCDFLLASDYGNKAVLQNTVDCCDNGYLILELLNDNIHGGLWKRAVFTPPVMLWTVLLCSISAKNLIWLSARGLRKVLKLKSAVLFPATPLTKWKFVAEICVPVCQKI